jgi:hypothetical protein
MWNLPTTEQNLLMTQIPTTIMHIINNNIKTFQENSYSIITFHPSTSENHINTIKTFQIQSTS